MRLQIGGYWALEAKDEGNGRSFVNSIALRLYLKGYDTSKDCYVASGGKLELLLDSHRYEEGFRYSEYKSGDKVAKYGIAALAAASVGGKVIKATGLLVFMKKYIGVIIAVIAAMIFKLKSYFKR